MLNEYYKLPLRSGDLFRGKEMPKCSLAESVAQMIHLIATTGFGECKYNPSFGCEIWELDFENVINSQLYREKLRKSIQNTIETHEPRIVNTKVDIQMEQIDYMMFNRKIKSRVRIKITGMLAKTNEPFTYTDQFFIGPLSYY
jgi:phage baseplate assembly protein W